MTLVLGSASPRRAALLRQVGIPFAVDPAEIDEHVMPHEAPVQYARRMAEEKLRAVMKRRSGLLVLTADTVVTQGGEVLGKPIDGTDGLATLSRLSGASHQVTTCFGLGRDGVTLSIESETTKVVFRELSAAEIEGYVCSGEGDDKAGGYAIQGLAAAFVRRIEGSYTNVVGLPVARVVELLQEHRELRRWPAETSGSG